MSFKKNIILTYNFEVKVNLCEQRLYFKFQYNYLKVDLWEMSNGKKSLVLDAASQILKGYKFIIYVSYLL